MNFRLGSPNPYAQRRFSITSIIFGITFLLVASFVIFNILAGISGRRCEYDMFMPGMAKSEKVTMPYQYNCMPYQERSVVYTNGKEVK